MLRRLGWTAVLCGLSLVASACTTADTKAQGEIAIGVTIEQTGASKALGVPETNALKLVLEDINKTGVLGKKVKLIIKDNKSIPGEAARQVKDLINEDKVVGIVGAGTSSVTLSMVDTVEERRVPTISMAASEAIVPPLSKRKFVFKTTPNGSSIVEVMMQEFAANGFKKVALLSVNNPYGDQAVRVLTSAVGRGGISVVGVERFDESQRDYSRQVASLVEKNPDAIVVASIMPGAAIAARNIKESGFQGRVYFDSGAGAELFVTGAGQASDGMYMVHTSILAANQIAATTPSALAQKEFFTAYTQKYGTFSGYASYAADALSLLVEAIKKAKSTDREKIRDALESLSYDGLTGSYQFGPANHGGASGDGLTVLTVRGGAWVLAQ
jgi:branched-chain amino acid transport system substrate-binding protein